MCSMAQLSRSVPAINEARLTQQEWAQRPILERLRIMRRLRHELANSAADLLKLFGDHRDAVDSLTAEILPLAEACRFLELRAKAILKPVMLSRRGRPFWQRGIDIQIRREPLGVVLVIGPANYPLFLPAVQALQALVAGNAVIWKPGLGGSAVARAFAAMAYRAGVPRSALQVSDESPVIATDLIREGVDKVVLTGSLETGKAVLTEAAAWVTPCVAELSGSDCVIVDQTADLDRAAKAIAFALRLNDGQTCIAPRRILVHSSVLIPLEKLMVCSHELPLLAFANKEEAVELANRSVFGLGAGVFGNPAFTNFVVERLETGVVVINDLIVPTADPRLPFGGRKLSGYGTTRGAEGLLEMTTLKAVATQRDKRLRHLEPLPNNSKELFLAFLEATHSSGWRSKSKAIVRLIQSVRGSL